MSWGVHPEGMLGHSVGEYVAAHLAGVFALEDALRVVAVRGRLMQAMAPGEMLAVGLGAHELQDRLPDGVEIAAVNAPSLCTVSGRCTAVAALGRELQRAGVESQRLHTSHAFHSAMMEPALAPFRDVVAGVTRSAPQRPYVSNVTGTWIAADQAISPDYYVEHLRRTVRFGDGVKTLAADPALMLLEVGPGHTLSSLARQSMGPDGTARVTSSLPHPRETRSQSEVLMAAVARLWATGVEIDWAGLHSDERLRRVPLPTYPFDRKPYRVDAPAPPRVSSVGSARRRDVKDWFYARSWARLPLAATKRRQINGVWLVLGGSATLAAGVAARLRATGATVVLAAEGASFSAHGDEYVLRFDVDEDYKRLFEELGRRKQAPRGILHIAAADAHGSSQKNATASMNALMALGRALVREMRSSRLRIIVATAGAQSVLGEPVTSPESAVVTGPVLALTAEDPKLHVTAIDLPDPSVAQGTEDAVEALFEEATADDDELFVARRAGGRWARRYIESALPAAEPEALPLKLRGVYLITGGTGGIGLTLARWLAERVQARLLLTARTPLIAQEGWDDWLASHD
jgi:acyl transferase domain-containing protein